MFTLGPYTVSGSPVTLNAQQANTQSGQPIVGALVYNNSNETFKIEWAGISDWLHPYSIYTVTATGNNFPNITLTPQDDSGSGSVYSTVYQQGDAMPANVPTTINATNVNLAPGSTVAITGTPTVDATGSTIDLASGTTVALAANTAVEVSNTVTVTPSGTINVQGVAGGTAIGVAGSVDIGSGTVDIGNTPAVTISGTPTVDASGSTIDLATGSTVAISGTPTVDATGSTVDLASGTTVAISGTPTVDATGSTINLASGTTVDLASGATVEISGTPTVNIGSGNDVVVTDIQNVTGNVSVVNPSSETPLVTRSMPVAADQYLGSAGAAFQPAANSSTTVAVPIPTTYYANQLLVVFAHMVGQNGTAVTGSFTGSASGTTQITQVGSTQTLNDSTGAAVGIYAMFTVISSSSTVNANITANNTSGNVAGGELLSLQFGETSSTGFSNFNLIGAVDSVPTISETSITGNVSAQPTSFVAGICEWSDSSSSTYPTAINNAATLVDFGATYTNLGAIVWYGFAYPSGAINFVLSGASAAPNNPNGIMVTIPQ